MLIWYGVAWRVHYICFAPCLVMSSCQCVCGREPRLPTWDGLFNNFYLIGVGNADATAHTQLLETMCAFLNKLLLTASKFTFVICNKAQHMCCSVTATNVRLALAMYNILALLHWTFLCEKRRSKKCKTQTRNYNRCELVYNVRSLLNMLSNS